MSCTGYFLRIGSIGGVVQKQGSISWGAVLEESDTSKEGGGGQSVRYGVEVGGSGLNQRLYLCNYFFIKHTSVI